MPRQVQNLSSAATRVHARESLAVDGSSREAGNKEALSFFGRSCDRYKEVSGVQDPDNVINAGVREWKFFEASLSRVISDISLYAGYFFV